MNSPPPHRHDTCQAIEEQTIDAEGSGDAADAPEMVAADALERLEKGDLAFEDK